ncbi:MAG TPA: SDR family oxidoreductase [Ktedonobacteraceae bacterium]|jgi:NAD(P)-dependent dehydrogenase (short-subunit alcohol dehydrogenase family)|nr:SDR family oxidoreductase [Ktedonobacteraceae bacterium]
MSSSQKSMQGKICLITGATSGIGKATALGLARMGATVVMVGRDRARSEAVQSEIKARSGNSAVDLLIADLSSQASIRQLVRDFQQRYPQLHVLINNAGVYMLTRKETVDGLEMTFAVNYLAPFLLTNLLLDTLKASAPARIVNVSSDAQNAGYIRMDDLQSRQRYRSMRAYGQSKLALTMFGYELARRLAGTGVTVNSLHPGFVATNIAQNNVPPPLRPVVKFFISLLGMSAQEGAETSLYLASSPDVEGVTGKYYIKCVPRPTVPISYDEALQAQLWEESMKLVHLEEQGPDL